MIEEKKSLIGDNPQESTPMLPILLHLLLIMALTPLLLMLPLELLLLWQMLITIVQLIVVLIAIYGRKS